MNIINTEPRVYCGTYAKYNSGSLEGRWMDLEDYPDKEEFLEACRELHKDETDPELMFQDWEGVPEIFISESSIEEETWEWLALEEEERKVCSIFCGLFGTDAHYSLNAFQDAFAGIADSPADFAENLAIEYSEIPLTGLASWVVIDWEASWNRNLRYDFCDYYDSDSENYYFFSRNW